VFLGGPGHTKDCPHGPKEQQQQQPQQQAQQQPQQQSPLMLYEPDMTASGRWADPSSGWCQRLAYLAWGLILPQQRVAWDLLLLLLLLWVAFAVPFIICFNVEVSAHGSTGSITSAMGSRSSRQPAHGLRAHSLQHVLVV
jgi:hypothetical protein